MKKTISRDFSIKRNRISVTPRNKLDSILDKQKNILNVSRKDFETKRLSQIKENFNKFLTIGSSELKEYSDFFKELDKIHKDTIDELKKEYGWIQDKTQTTMSMDSIEENVFIDE
jgi:anion-transporting  ArsA/GET3 family ATPase